MLLWTNIVGGLLGGIGNLIGGSVQANAQREANETNLQIARETNEMQRDIVAQNNELQYRMFNESNYYNSPANQRALLEAAGYNPYSLYQNPSGAVAQSQSLPQLQQPQFAVPQVMPETAFGSAIQSAVSQAANVLKTLNESREIKNRADIAEMQKNTYQQEFLTRIKGMISDNEYKDLTNSFLRSSLDDRINAVWLDNQTKQINNSVLNQQLRSSVFEYELMRDFGYKLKQAELNKIVSESNLNDEKSLSEVVHRYAMKYDVDYKKALLTINRYQAETDRINAQTSQFEAQTHRLSATATIANIQEQTKSQRLDNQMKEFRNLFNLALEKSGNGPLSNQLKRDIWDTALTPARLRANVDLMRDQANQAKSSGNYLQWLKWIQAAEAGAKVLETISKTIPQTSPTSGYSTGAPSVDDTYNILYGSGSYGNW